MARTFAIAYLGPNESRIAYDFCAACGALLFAKSFVNFFLPGNSLGNFGPLLWIPVGFILVNALLGIYSRKRTAPGREKVLLLLASITAVSASALLMDRQISIVSLWAMLVTGPVTLARLLVGLRFSRHKDLKAIVLDSRGPVLVIGGAGYIGSHTVDLLLKQGKKVRVLDRLMYGSESLKDFVGKPNFELIVGDATDIMKLTFAMRDASAVVHLAGLVGDPACAVDSELTRHTNVIATRMAKDVAHSLGVRRFVFASSCSVYGMSDREVNELDELNPVSLYAQTKIDSERELLHAVNDDFFVTVLRFATVFGHSQRPRFDLVGNLFTAQAMTSGLITVIGPDQWRPFVHVRDLARAIVLVLNTSPALVQGQIFNVGDSRLNLTILQLAEVVKSVVGKYRDINIVVTTDRDDPRNYAVSFKKIRGTIGFECQSFMEEGIQEMVDNFQSGRYNDFRHPIYSNLATTKQLLKEFYDPEAMTKLYGPLSMVAKGHS